MGAVSRNKQAVGCVPVDVDEDLLSGWVEDCIEVPLAQDRDDVLRKVRKNGMYLFNAFDFCGDRDVVTAAVQENGMALEFTELRDDRDIVLAAVRQNGMALQFATSRELRRDREIVLEAIRTAPRARRFAIDVPLFDVDPIPDAQCMSRKKQKGTRLGRGRHALPSELRIEQRVWSVRGR